MDIETVIDSASRLRIHKIEGQITPEELTSSLKKVYDRLGRDVEMNSLWDLVDADVSGFNMDDLMELRDVVLGQWGGSGRRSALLVSKAFDFGIGRMYQSLVDSRTDNEIGVFMQRNEAIEWLCRE